MVDDPPGPHCSRRLFEWAMAIALMAFGLHVLLFPGTMASSRYAGVLLVLSIAQFGLVCILLGGVRVVALRRNGLWPHWGPRIRALAALGACAIWLQLAVSLAQHASPGLWIYVVLAGAELRSVWRARRDANGSRHQ